MPIALYGLHTTSHLIPYKLYEVNSFDALINIWGIWGSDKLTEKPKQPQS